VKASIKRFLFGSLFLSAATAATIQFVRAIRHEIVQRGYPSWHECHCDYKHQPVIFQVWHNETGQQGETVVSHEWGIYLVHLPRWIRYVLHHAAQVFAVLNPSGRYLERILLTPQEAYQFALLLHTRTTNEDLPEPPPEERPYVAWRREILHSPRYLFDANIRRLYPAYISRLQPERAEALPILWDHTHNLPLPTEGSLLETPIGTRVDLIGWSNAQISYCTARIHA
jgi:hypothetical protein